jgi:monoamine oxidase
VPIRRVSVSRRIPRLASADLAFTPFHFDNAGGGLAGPPGTWEALMQCQCSVDVAIIGAGAAGLAAASALSTQPLSVLVIEARNRIGGRALTQRFPDNLVFDVGCEWLHSAEQNEFASIARRSGFELACCQPRWGEQSFGINFPLSEQREFDAALQAFEDRVEAASSVSNDSSAADWLEAGNRWNPLIDAISTYVNGTELSKVSVHDTSNYHDSGLNWRVHEGYGALIAELGDLVDVALNSAASRVNHSGDDIEIETSRGTVRSRVLICTLPSNLLAAEFVRFSPPLHDKIAAAAGLPLGHAEKALLSIDAPELLPVDGHLFGKTDRRETGSYDLRPLGRSCIQAFFGGSLAMDLAKNDALAEFAIEELVALFGSEIRGRIAHVASSAWTSDRFASGSYSYALPGCGEYRSVLAAPIDDRLFFAGEATSPNFFSTAHGAYQSGLRAAAEVIAALERRTPRHPSRWPSVASPSSKR